MINNDKFLISAIGIIVSLLLTCCHSASQQSQEEEKADFSHEAELWADSIARAMTDEQLVGQLIMPAIYARTDAAVLQRLGYYTDSLHICGIMLLKGDTASASTISNFLKTNSMVPPFVAIDAEWGLGMRLTDAPSYPPFSELGPKATEIMMFDYGYGLGLQSNRLGINIIFGPVLDVASVPQSTMRRRSLGASPQNVAELGVAYAHGLEEAGIISVAKHFPGLGATSIDSHKYLPTHQVSREKLDTTDLLPFRNYVFEQLSGIMVGHVAVTALDTIMRSAALSPMVIDNLLRQQYGFNGLVFTDALNMGGVGDNRQPALHALLAGADILVAPADSESACHEILQALSNGSISRETLMSHVRRILFFKYRYRSLTCS